MFGVLDCGASLGPVGHDLTDMSRTWPSELLDTIGDRSANVGRGSQACQMHQAGQAGQASSK